MFFAVPVTSVHSHATMRVAVLRFFNPVGAHPTHLCGEYISTSTKGSLMMELCRVALGNRSNLDVFGNDWNTPDGTCIRDYIHVVDLAKGHICALESLFNDPKPGGFFEVWNLGSGRGVSVLQLIKAMEVATGSSIPYRLVPFVFVLLLIQD